MIDFKTRKEIEANTGKPTTFEQLINWYLLEGASKELKEKGQREMNKIESNPFLKLREYLIKKWDGKITKEDLKKKRMEFGRFNFLITMSNDMIKESDPEAKEYLKQVLGTKPIWATLDNGTLGDREQSRTLGGGDSVAVLALGYPTIGKDYSVNGFKFKEPSEKLKKIIRKFIILHEYGHFYDWLKQMVENNEGYLTDTMRATPEEVVDSEWKANSYAIERMYRKDKRELLKASGLKSKDLVKSSKVANSKTAHMKSDEYKAGLLKHSDSIDKYLDKINEENYFPY